MSARTLKTLADLKVGDVVRRTQDLDGYKRIDEITVDRVDGSYVETVRDWGTSSIYFFGANSVWELIERPVPPLPTAANSAIQILELSRTDEYSSLELPVLAFRVDDSVSPWITGGGEDYLWIASTDILEWRPMKVVPA